MTYYRRWLLKETFTVESDFLSFNISQSRDDDTSEKLAVYSMSSANQIGSVHNIYDNYFGCCRLRL